MKETDPWEKQLNYWRPRRPSAGLKRRLFGVTAGLVPRTRWLLGSLAPAFACALITLSIYNNGNNLHRSAKTAVILIPGQQDRLAYTPDASRMRENNWLAVTFDWTNHSSFTSSIPSFPRNSMN